MNSITLTNNTMVEDSRSNSCSRKTTKVRMGAKGDRRRNSIHLSSGGSCRRIMIQNMALPSASALTTIAFLILLVCLLNHHPPIAHAFSPWQQSISSGRTGSSSSSSSPTLPAPKSATATFSSTVLWRQPSKWDLILDDDDDEDNNDSAAGPRQYTPCPPDMMYEPRIVQRAHQTFLAIRQAGGKETTNDVYVRDPIDKQVMWYTGKVARVSDVSLEECIHRLYPIIERHACHLRPKELYPHRGGGGGELEVWTAPGDSELEIAYNRPTLQMQRFVHSKEWQYKAKNTKYPSHVKASMVGFQGEVYQEGEDGFRTWRHDDGLPARPEINAGGETRPPTEEELAQFQKELLQQQPQPPPQPQQPSSVVGGESSDSDIIDAVITKDAKSNAKDE